MPRNTGEKTNAPKMGIPNGPLAGAAVPAKGALAANFPPVSTGEGNLAQDDAVANFPPVSTGEDHSSHQEDWEIEKNPAADAADDAPADAADDAPADDAPAVVAPAPAPAKAQSNFHVAHEKPDPETMVNPNSLDVARILSSLDSLKLFFSKPEDSVPSRKSFKGGSSTKNRFDSRFRVESLPKDVVAVVLEKIGVEAPKKSTGVSSGGRAAAFLKTNLGATSMNAASSVAGGSPDVLESIFGSNTLPISFCFSTPFDKKQDAVIPQKTMKAISSFLSSPTWKGFIDLFSQSEGKATQRYENNLKVFTCLLSQHFASIEGEDARFTAKMRLFLDIMSAQNQKCLFNSSSRTHQFLFELAIELLRKLGRDTNRVSFDDASSSHAAIVVLIFKYLYQKYDGLDEEDEKFQLMLVQLFRTMTECFSANNGFLIENICFVDKKILSEYLVRITSQSTGLSHNSLLDCDLRRFMLDPVEVWKKLHQKNGIFAWIAETGSGKSTLLLLLMILEAIESKANVFYIGPQTATMNPEYVATIIEVVCQFLESCGRERPVIRLNQSGVTKPEAGVVNVFMTRVAGHCLPILSSVLGNTPSIVAVDDNTQLSPEQLIRLFSKFNLSKLNICGSTIDLTGCGDVVHIGGDVAASVSFCAPTFMDQSGRLPMHPDAFREFLLETKELRTSWRKFSNAECCNVFISFLNLHAGKISAVFESLSSFTPLENIRVMDLVNHAKILYQEFPAYREFLSLFQQNAEKVQTVFDFVCSFTSLERIRFVDLVKVARLLHRGFPTFQVGKVYSVKELNEITGLVRRFIKILHRNGFVFDNERLQFPKDLSKTQRQKECKQIIDAAWKGTSAQIILTDADQAYDLERKLVSDSEAANMPIMSSSKGLSTSKPDDKDPTGGKASGSFSEDTDSEDETEPPNNEEEDGSGKKSKPSKPSKPSKQRTKPKPLKPKPLKPNQSKPIVSINSAVNTLAEYNHSVNDAANDANFDAAAAAAAAAASAAAETSCLSANDADNGSSEQYSGGPVEHDSRMTLLQILNGICKATELVGHRSLPERGNVIEALSILRKCGHPDSARWLKSFIYGVVLLDGIMPSQFIELCFRMFDLGRIIFVLAHEMFHLQSWNSKCSLRMKIIVANPVPEWHLRQTMARAGRMGTEHFGEISSWVSSLVLTKSDVSASGSVSEEQLPLVILNGESICPIEKAIMAMVFRGNFSWKHHDFIVDFLRLFRFVYRDQVCVHAFKGGRDYFMDFMRIISAVLVSKYVSPFECVLSDLTEESICELAFTKFRHGIVDDEEGFKKDFGKKFILLVSPESASMSLCLVKAIDLAKDFTGISHFVLPRLFKELYGGYHNSMTFFLTLIQNLLMILQTSDMCKFDRNIDATVSAMLFIITTTLDFVRDILSLLADKLRERDMEQFRVGFKPNLSPMEQLRQLLNRKAGIPTLKDFSAFINTHASELPALVERLRNILLFLSPNPSGPYHEMKQESLELKASIDAIGNQKKDLLLSKAKPESMKPSVWVQHVRTPEFKERCEQIDKVELPQLESEVRKLVDNLALIEKELGNLPNDLSDVVAYFGRTI
jgi:hypothetical protein